MDTKKEWINYCLTRGGVYEDYPFDDPNWAVMRHAANRKAFAFVYERGGGLCLNLKCSPALADFLRRQYKSLAPGYHMNKEHWNTVTVGGDVPDDEIKGLIVHSYELTKPKIKTYPK
ncbi:MAG: MmcQ/YjbR family DNA-binding protein [Clostridiales bacterium]|jgi:predicted DNA-binding protein (MmcQ/YjbR family)|nr:MmcQ/YjbR family DNA-binding protein [Clostridiales bacterium]